MSEEVKEVKEVKTKEVTPKEEFKSFDLVTNNYKIEIKDQAIHQITHKDSGRTLVAAEGEKPTFTALDYQELLADLISENKAYEIFAIEASEQLRKTQEEANTFFERMIEAEKLLEENKDKLEG